MTKEECIALLNRYAEYNGMGIPNLAGCREAMKTAAELLQQPPLPSNLDEVEKEYAENVAYGEPGRVFTASMLGFRDGAQWMAGQGYTREVEVKEDAGGYPYIPCIELYDYDKDEPLFKPVDKIVVQIRKK